MRVLVVTNMYPTEARPFDGIFVSREVEALRAHAEEVEVDVLHVRTGESRMRYLTGRRTFEDRVRAFRPDVVHVHYGLTQAVCIGWRGPKVVTFHGSDLNIPWQRRVSVLAARRWPAVPVLVNARLLERLPAPLRDRALVVPCGVDPAEFVPGDREVARAAIGQPVDDPRPLIGFPASPDKPGKDYPLFERSIEALQASGTAARTMAIDGFTPAQMPDVVRALDLLLMTSRYEGSPVVTKEALCAGTRVVSVDVGDVAEQLSGFSGCALVERRDAGCIASALRTALDEPAPDPTLAAQRFGIEREVSGLLGAYRAAVASA